VPLRDDDDFVGDDWVRLIRLLRRNRAGRPNQGDWAHHGRAL